MGIKQKESPNRGRFVLIALLVAATVLFAVWALAFHHHNLCVFLVSNYQSTLALLPTLTLLGMLAMIDLFLEEYRHETNSILIGDTNELIGMTMDVNWENVYRSREEINLAWMDIVANHVSTDE